MRAVTARRCRSDGTPPLEAPPRAVTCRRGRARGKARGCAACGARAWGRAAVRRERAGARVGVREGARARALEIVRVRGCARECSWADARRSPEQRGCTELFIPEVAVGLRTVGAGLGPLVLHQRRAVLVPLLVAGVAASHAQAAEAAPRHCRVVREQRRHGAEFGVGVLQERGTGVLVHQHVHALMQTGRELTSVPCTRALKKCT